MNKDEFVRVFDPYYDKLLDYISHITLDYDWAQEVTQEIFLEAYKNPNQFLETDNMEAMLKTAAMHKFLNIHKKEKQYIRLTGKIASEMILENIQLVEEILEDKERHDLLIVAIRQLPPKLKQIIQLNYIDNMSMVEVSHILGIRYTTALARRNSALKRLNRALNKMGISKTNYFILFCFYAIK